MMNKEVTFGLIGYGAWGACHARAIDETDGAKILAICSLSERSQKLAGEQFPAIDIYGSYEQLLDREDIDAVDIVTPPYLHYPIAKLALEKGKHVLLEKPMALEVEHCQELNEIAKSKRLTLAIGHEFRLSSQWGKIKEIIDSGGIGSPQYVMVELSRKPYRQGSDGWRRDISKVGSWILEEPIHFFDLARWYLSEHGNPRSVYGVANSIQPGRSDLHDNFSAFVQWENGPYAVVSQTLASFEHHQTVKVSGTKGALWASWSGALDRTDNPACFLKYFDGETVEDLPLAAKSGEVFELRSEIAMMLECVSAGKSPVASAEDGLWSTALCLAAEQSVKINSAVELDSFLKE